MDLLVYEGSLIITGAPLITNIWLTNFRT